MENLKFGPVLFLKSHNENTRNSSIISRPTRHIGNICLCYSNAGDCTTCNNTNITAISSNSSLQLNSFSSFQKRLCAGSSSIETFSCSSDGSSFYEHIVPIRISSTESICSSSKEENVKDLYNSIGVIRKQVHEKLLETREIINSSTKTLGQLKVMDNYHISQISDEIVELEQKIEHEKNVGEKCMAELEESFKEIKELGNMFQAAKNKYKQILKEHMHGIMSEELMKTNSYRSSEIRSKIYTKLPESEIDGKQVKELELLETNLSTFLEKTSDRIEEETSTCLSFCRPK